MKRAVMMPLGVPSTMEVTAKRVNSIEQLRTDGMTVLLVTHELAEAEQLCDRVVAMRAGRVLDSGTPAELVDRYGRSATVSFTLSVDHSLEMLPRLGLLPGVSDVREQAGKVTVSGTRAVVAHVGAELVAAGWVPPTWQHGYRAWRTPSSASWNATVTRCPTWRNQS